MAVMQSAWQPVRVNNLKNDNNIQQNSSKKTTKTLSKWSDEMLATHLPIYPIHYDNENEYKISKVLFDAISPSVCCVLLGESTHGTHEFYALRSFITKYLILYKGFTAIFMELDWPKVYRLNEYVLHTLEDENIDLNQLFNDIKYYPHWMGRNKIIKELVIWLRAYNGALKKNNKASEMVSFYGIDMQCYDSLNILKKIYEKHKKLLPHSMQIISFLKDIKLHFSHWTEVHYTSSQISKIFHLFISSKYKLLQKHKHNRRISDLIFNIDQNFMTLQSAINYFNNDCLWDIRDNHWFNTCEKYFYYKSNCQYLGFEQMQYATKPINKGKLCIWAHNSHVCNNKYYTHSNIGAMLKNKYGERFVFTICLDSFKGTVTATKKRNQWAQFYTMNENVNESFGKLFHKLSNKWRENNLMIFLQNGINKMMEMEIKIKPKYFVKVQEIEKKTKVRDIGVCYITSSAYYHCSNGNILQIADVMIFVNESNALEPFDCDKHNDWDKNRKIWLLQNNNKQTM